jgi:hypothetical protein
MSERDGAEERFQAWAARQALAPPARKYACRRWEDRILATAAVIVTALFWAAVLFGVVHCVGQAMAQPAAQPSVQNPFERGASPRAQPKPERPRQAPAGLSDAEIAKRLIAESIAGYSGSCACPYQSDRAGRSCGRRSAYHRPRGAAPLCFEADVTPELLAAARARR